MLTNSFLNVINNKEFKEETPLQKRLRQSLSNEGLIAHPDNLYLFPLDKTESIKVIPKLHNTFNIVKQVQDVLHYCNMEDELTYSFPSAIHYKIVALGHLLFYNEYVQDLPYPNPYFPELVGNVLYLNDN